MRKIMKFWKLRKHNNDECNEIDDQVMTQKVSEYVQRKIVSCEVESVVYGNIFISDEEGRVQGMSFFEFGRDWLLI